MVDVYERVTASIMGSLDSGTVPWRQSWNMARAQNIYGHRNAATGRAYTGINPLLLMTTATDRGYRDPYWLTYKQAQACGGGTVRRGEHGTSITFAHRFTREVERETEDGATETKTRSYFGLREYTVFNVAQCTGLTLPAATLAGLAAPGTVRAEPEILESCERIIANMPNAPVVQDGRRACYSPRRDVVEMPPAELFDTPQDRYAVLYHELTHSTGHSSRLDRGLDAQDRLAPFGSAEYSAEELVAEMGAAYLCAHAEIDTAPLLGQSAAYIAGWLRALADDRRLLVSACSKAFRAAEYILGHQPEPAV